MAAGFEWQVVDMTVGNHVTGLEVGPGRLPRR